MNPINIFRNFPKLYYSLILIASLVTFFPLQASEQLPEDNSQPKHQISKPLVQKSNNDDEQNEQKEDQSSTYQLPIIDQTYKRKDPPFFHFRANNKRDVYILGSPHTVPINILLSDGTINELIKISNKKSILYTEHESTNKVTLSYLKKEENRIDNDSIEKEMDLLSLIKMGEEKKKKFRTFGNEKIHFDLNKESDSTFKDVLAARLWLGANILGAHANILSYRKFGGLECTLQYHNDWKDTWVDIRYLEKPEEVIEILKGFREEDKYHNDTWARKSIEKIFSVKENTNTEWNAIFKQSLSTYEWEVIKFDDIDSFPKSVFKRNKLWAAIINNALKEKEDNPILIVVGTGHLAGVYKGVSFLSELINQIEPDWMERFTLQNQWEKTWEKQND